MSVPTEPEGSTLATLKDYALVLLAPAAALALVFWVANLERAGAQPDSELRAGAFDVRYPSGDEDEARRVAALATRFAGELHHTYSPVLGPLDIPAAGCRMTLYGEGSPLDDDDRRSWTGGYHRAGECALTIGLSMRTDALDETVRHEVGHLTLGVGGGRVWQRFPYWLSEGLAEWLAHARMDRIGTDAEPPSLFDTARELSLRALLGAQRSEHLTANDRALYRRAHWLVHRLIATRPDAFWRFVREARGRGTSAAHFEATFGDPDGLQRDLERP